MRPLLLVIALVLCAAPACRAADALVLQSTSDRAYGEAVRGFRSVYQGSVRTVVLKEYAEVDVVRLVKEEKPQVVLAVGDAAYAACRRVREVAVLAVLAPALSRRNLPGNVTGIDIIAAPEHYLKLCRSLGRRRIGVLYDPVKMGQYVNQAARLARELGVALERCEVHNAPEIQAGLERMKGRIDALWMLPDTTVLAAAHMEALLIFSISNRVPLFSYLKQHLKSGAAVSLDIDGFDIGKQAGELVAARNGRIRGSLLHPRKVLVHTNEQVLRKLGITAGAAEAIPGD